MSADTLGTEAVCSRCGRPGAGHARRMCEHCGIAERLCGGCASRDRSSLCAWCAFALGASP
jgi:hypothetical protein